MTTISIVENASVPLSYSEVAPTSAVLLLRAIVMQSVNQGDTDSNVQFESSIPRNSIVVITDKFDVVRSAIGATTMESSAIGGARRLKRAKFDDDADDSPIGVNVTNINTNTIDGATDSGVVFSGSFRGVTFDIPIVATSSGIDYIIPAQHPTTIVGLIVPGKRDVLFKSFADIASVTETLSFMWNYVVHYGLLPPIDEEEFKKSGKTARSNAMQASTNWRPLLGNKGGKPGESVFTPNSDILALVTYPWKAPVINNAVVTGTDGDGNPIDRIAPLMAFVNLGAWDEFYGQNREVATINLMEKPWLMKNKSSIGMNKIAAIENGIMIVRNVIKARYGAKRLTRVDNDLITQKKNVHSIADILSTLSESEFKLIEADYKRAVNDLETLKNNKCKHKDLLREMDKVTMRKDMLDLADAIEKLAMIPLSKTSGKSGEYLKCKMCHLNLICPHRLELYRLRAMNASYNELNTLRKKWGTRVDTDNGRDGESRGESAEIVCAICGDEFNEIVEEDQLYLDTEYNGYTQDPELSSQLWGDISQLMRYFVVSSEVGLSVRAHESVISAVKNQTYPIIEALNNALSKTKSESEQELSARRIIYISIYDMVFLMLYARSNPTVLSMRGVKGTIGVGDVKVAAKLVASVRAIQRNLVGNNNFAPEMIETIMGKVFERYKNEKTINTLPRLAVNKLLDLLGLETAIWSVAELAGVTGPDAAADDADQERLQSSVIYTYLHKRDRREIEKSKNPYDSMQLVAHEDYAKKWAETLRAAFDKSDGEIDFADHLPISESVLYVAALNEYILYLRRGDYLNILAGLSSTGSRSKGGPEITSTLGLSAERIEIIEMFRRASQALKILRNRIVFTEVTRPWLKTWDPVFKKFEVKSEGIKMSYDVQGRKHKWDMYVLSNGETIKRGAVVPAPLRIVEPKCSVCGLSYSEALKTSNAEVLVGLETANAADNFYQYYRLLCPEGERHILGDDGKCTKCGIEPGTRDPAYAKKYRDKYRADIMMSQAIENSMFGIGKMVKDGGCDCGDGSDDDAIVGIDANGLADLANLDYSSDDEDDGGDDLTGLDGTEVITGSGSPKDLAGKTADDIYVLSDGDIGTIASKLKINSRLIQHIGAYAKTSVAEIVNGKHIAAPVLDRNDARIANLRGYIADLIIIYNSIVTFADQIDDRGHTTERQFLRKMGYEKSSIVSFASSLPSIIDIQKGLFGGTTFREQFQLVENFLHPQKIHDYCLQAYCSLVAYFISGGKSAIASSTVPTVSGPASNYLETFGVTIISQVLEWNSRSTMPGYFKWSILYGDDTTTTAANAGDGDEDGEIDLDDELDTEDTGKRDLLNAAAKEDSGGDPLGDDGFDVESVGSDTELIHVGDEYGM